MKKLLLALALAALASAGAFARMPLSAGVGAVFDGGRIGGLSDAGFAARANALGFGAYGFLSARFAELSVAFVGGPASWEERHDLHPAQNIDAGGSLFALNISLLGKFPFRISGGGVYAFPMLGIGYGIALSLDGRMGDLFAVYGIGAGGFSAFRFLFGAGADFAVAEGMFVRAALLGSWRFPPDAFAYMAEPGEIVRGGFGAAAKIGVGFRL